MLWRRFERFDCRVEVIDEKLYVVAVQSCLILYFWYGCYLILIMIGTEQKIDIKSCNVRYILQFS